MTPPIRKSATVAGSVLATQSGAAFASDGPTMRSLRMWSHTHFCTAGSARVWANSSSA